MNNLVSFFEIPSTDFQRAVKFYEVVLNVQFNIMEDDREKMAFFTQKDGESCGGGAISWAEDFKPSKDGVLVSLSCKDIDVALSLIEKNGGKTMMSKTQIEVENAGYFALFIDCEGNRMGLWSAN